MGVIQKMRDRGGLMLAMVGGGIVLFILGDFVRSMSQMGTDLSVVGTVGDYDISTAEYHNYLNSSNSADDAAKEKNAEKAWSTFTERNVYRHIFNNVHLSYSNDERDYMLYDETHFSVVQQAMQFNQQMGNIAPLTYGSKGDEIRNFVSIAASKDESGQFAQVWDNFAGYSLKDVRLKEKYKNLLINGMFTTKAMAEDADAMANSTFKVRYVYTQMNTISDSSISVTESELKEYYNLHREDYKASPTRDIKYVQFNVVPSDEDHLAAQKEMLTFKEELKGLEMKDVADYALNLSTGGVDRQAFAKGELVEQFDSVFFNNENAIVGPYREGNKWKMKRVSTKEIMPDSVKASHILFKYEGRTKERAKELADSIYNVFKNDSTGFAESAKLNSDDGSAAKGGDLGWFNEAQMVTPFNDACFLGNKGDLVVVESRFGMHVISVVDQLRPKERIIVTTIEKTVFPSKKTIKNYSIKATRFARDLKTTEQFDQAVLADPELSILTKEDLKASSFAIAGITNPRPLILWAFANEVGAVSKPYQFGNAYVIATVTEANNNEYKTLEDATVRIILESQLRKEKKAEQIKEDMTKALAGVNSIDELAKKMGPTSSVNEDPNARFTNKGLQGKVNDGEVLGRLIGSESGKLVGPFVGSTAVYVMVVEPLTVADANINLEDDYSTINRSTQQAVNSQMIEAYKGLLKVEDMRLEVDLAKR